MGTHISETGNDCLLMLIDIRSGSAAVKLPDKSRVVFVVFWAFRRQPSGLRRRMVSPRRWVPLERSRSWGFFLVSPDIPGAGSPWRCLTLSGGEQRGGAGGSGPVGALEHIRGAARAAHKKGH